MWNAEIKVSVLCTAYNHEKYIRQCLDGFVSQKTDFAFEVLINDDASTDNTAKIIKEYEEKYPEIIKPIYQKENQHSQKIKITSDILFPRAKGKYIALCEGDDYWIDDYKLQKQVDALEKNPDCFMCTHITQRVNESGANTGKNYPSDKINSGVFNNRQFLERIIDKYNFHTSSYFFLSEKLGEYYRACPEFRRVARVGDEPLQLYFGMVGNVYFIAEQMSCYRENSISSWSRNVRVRGDGAIKHSMSLIAMYEKFDEFSQYRYHNFCFHRISKEKYRIQFLKKNYKILTKGEYRENYKKDSKKNKFIIRMHILFPKLFPLLLKVYRKIRGYNE